MEEINLSYLIVLLLGLVLLWIISFLASNRDILSPPSIMISMFIISTLFALFNAKEWRIDYQFLSMWYILSGIFVFAIPNLFGSMLLKPDDNLVVRRPLKVEMWKILFAIIVDIIIIYMYKKEMIRLAETFGYYGDNIQWFFRNLTSYQGEAEVRGFIRVVVRFVDITAYIFMYTFINNKLIYKSKGKIDYLMLVPIYLFIYKTSLTGGRQDILRLIFAGVVISYILRKTVVGWKKNISTKYIFIGMLGILIGIPSFYYALFFVGRTTTRTLMQSVSTYLGGPIQHFNQYIMNPAPPSKYFGSESLTPILNLLGKLGIIDFNETIHLEFRILSITRGNVYTFFRRPLHDFGWLGMYIFILLISLFFSWYYYKVIRSNKRTLQWDIHVLIYSYLLYWIFLSSIDQYSMTIISLFTLIAIVLFYVLSYFYWELSVDKLKLKLKVIDKYIIYKKE